MSHLAGYTSWYNYYQNINEEIILRDLEGLERAGESANIFQIDDGYETKVGDWDIDATKFPNGLKPIVDRIHEKGLKAGLWLAPFAVQFGANLVKEHPDWFIRNKRGRKVISGIAWGGFTQSILKKKKYVRISGLCSTEFLTNGASIWSNSTSFIQRRFSRETAKRAGS